MLYGRASLERRRDLPVADAFWLDYWNFLHEADTHRIWSVRPLAISSIAEAAFSAEGLSARSLVFALGRELESYRYLDAYLHNPTPEGGPVTSRGTLAREWLTWLEPFMDHAIRESFHSRLVEATVATARRENLHQLAFFARRLSSELSDDATLQGRRNRALWAFLHADVGGFEDRLRLFVSRPEQQRWVVRFWFLPITVNASLSKASGLHNRLITEIRSGRWTLLGVESTVLATGMETAVAVAHRNLRDTLERLRTRRYLRVQLDGKVTVELPDGTERILSIPQAFWVEQVSTRRAPQLPTGFDEVAHHRQVDPEKRSRWLAARWQLSQALAIWPEDQHSAASHVWQALEAFAGSVTGVERAVAEYSARVRAELLQTLAAKFTTMRLRWAAQLGECDWPALPKGAAQQQIWWRATLSATGPRSFATWRTPTAPLIIFAPNAGLARGIAVAGNARPQRWISDRLRQDLRHLYGLRNAAVHSGISVGTEEWASHIGRQGIEILYELLDSEVQTSRAMLRSKPVEPLD